MLQESASRVLSIIQDLNKKELVKMALLAASFRSMYLINVARKVVSLLPEEYSLSCLAKLVSLHSLETIEKLEKKLFIPNDRKEAHDVLHILQFPADIDADPSTWCLPKGLDR